MKLIFYYILHSQQLLICKNKMEMMTVTKTKSGSPREITQWGQAGAETYSILCKGRLKSYRHLNLTLD